MGLEAINFFFCIKKENSIKELIEKNNKIKKIDEKRYIYTKENYYWIDLELQNKSCLSIRITLCNPTENVLGALDELLNFLFCFNEGVLNNLNTKEIFTTYNNYTKERIIESFKERKKVFISMYENFTAAISSEEFYNIQRSMRESEK